MITWRGTAVRARRVDKSAIQKGPSGGLPHVVHGGARSLPEGALREIRGDMTLLRFEWPHCIVTFGERGVLAKWSERECYLVEGPAVEAANTVGAGDIIAAIVVAALLRGYDISTGVQLGATAAIRAVQSRHWSEWLGGATGADVLAGLKDMGQGGVSIRRIV